jgi:hypothetical protein
MSISVAAELTDQASLVVFPVSEAERGGQWRKVATWSRDMRTRHGTIRLVAGHGRTLYLGVVNLTPFPGEILRVERDGARQPQ